MSPSEGNGSVAGHDLRRSRADARASLGYMAQKFSLYGSLSVKQNLDFFAGAYGLARAGESVRVLDGSDNAFRATRGNFGLVTVQSKGIENPAYHRWTRLSADSWAGLAAELHINTGFFNFKQNLDKYVFYKFFLRR